MRILDNKISLYIHYQAEYLFYLYIQRQEQLIIAISISNRYHNQVDRPSVFIHL